MIEFNGQRFATMEEWARAFPAYGKHMSQYVKRGAKTPHEIEVMRHADGAGKKRRVATKAQQEMVSGLARRGTQ